MSPPRILAMLDLSKETERDTHAFLKRACSGRWPMWRLLGMRRQGNSLAVAVEWLRRNDPVYSLVQIALDEIVFTWRNFATAVEVRAALAAFDFKPRPPTAPAGPAAASTAL